MQEQSHAVHQLKQLFSEADSDNSGTLTVQELDKQLDDPKVRAQLAALGMELHEARGLFGLLDVSGQGTVSIEELVVGFMRLKGGAKSIDLATLMTENKRTNQQVQNLGRDIRELTIVAKASLQRRAVPEENPFLHWSMPDSEEV